MTCLLFWAAARRFYQLCAVWKVSVELERSAACDAQHIHQFLSKSLFCRRSVTGYSDVLGCRRLRCDHDWQK